MRLFTSFLTLLLLLAACAPPTPEVIPAPAGNPVTATNAEELAAFTDTLRQAVTAKDFTVMQKLMGDPFVIAYWRGPELPELAPGDAVGQMQTILMAGGPITFPEPDVPLAEMLGGREPLSLWRAEDRVVGVVYSRGWEQNGLAEAMLFIAQSEDGTLVGKGILVAPTGFERTM